MPYFTFSLFVAVLVDNFQRTLSATEKNKKAATFTVFQVRNIKMSMGNFSVTALGYL